MRVRRSWWRSPGLRSDEAVSGIPIFTDANAPTQRIPDGPAGLPRAGNAVMVRETTIDRLGKAGEHACGVVTVRESSKQVVAAHAVHERHDR